MSTGYVSPQFRVIFDDLFETVIRTGDNDAVINSICDGLFDQNRELYVDPLIPGHVQTMPRSVSFTCQHHLNVAREPSWLS